MAFKRNTGGLPVSIDYSLSLREMIRLSSFGEINTWNFIEENFPISGKGIVERNLEVVSFQRRMSIAMILEELLGRKLRPASIEDLLAFSGKYSGQIGDSPIICLGSTWFHSNGFNTAPFVHNRSSCTIFRLSLISTISPGGDWPADYQYLATPDETLDVTRDLSRYLDPWIPDDEQNPTSDSLGVGLFLL